MALPFVLSIILIPITLLTICGILYHPLKGSHFLNAMLRQRIYGQLRTLNATSTSVVESAVSFPSKYQQLPLDNKLQIAAYLSSQDLITFERSNLESRNIAFHLEKPRIERYYQSLLQMTNISAWDIFHHIPRIPDLTGFETPRSIAIKHERYHANSAMIRGYFLKQQLAFIQVKVHRIPSTCWPCTHFHTMAYLGFVFKPEGPCMTVYETSTNFVGVVSSMQFAKKATFNRYSMQMIQAFIDGKRVCLNGSVYVRSDQAKRWYLNTGRFVRCAPSGTAEMDLTFLPIKYSSWWNFVDMLEPPPL